MLNKSNNARPGRTLISQCADLITKKSFHQQEAKYYHGLFNESAPVPDFDQPGEIIIPALTPLQEFWQQMTQHHKAEMFKVDKLINDLCGA